MDVAFGCNKEWNKMKSREIFSIYHFVIDNYINVGNAFLELHLVVDGSDHTRELWWKQIVFLFLLGFLSFYLEWQEG